LNKALSILSAIALTLVNPDKLILILISKIARSSTVAIARSTPVLAISSSLLFGIYAIP
jgi:hypothetical protein